MSFSGEDGIFSKIPFVVNSDAPQSAKPRNGSDFKTDEYSILSPNDKPYPRNRGFERHTPVAKPFKGKGSGVNG